MRHGLLAVVLFSAGLAQAQQLTGPEIISKVNEIMNPATSRARMKMTIHTTTGRKRTFVYESYSVNHGEKTLVRYVEPRRVAGQAILMLNHADDIWIYFPRTNRVRKLATHAKRQKVEGSDFSYEDMGAGEAFITDFDAVLIGEEKVRGARCYKLELRRRADSNSSYSRMIMWVRRDDFVPVRVDYYDDRNPKLRVKRLELSDIRTIDGIPTPMRMVMTDLLDNTQTELEFLDVRYNVKLPQEMFTERGLRK